jgi:hypothetical protein
MKSTIFFDVIACIPAEIHWHFSGILCFQLPGQRASQANQATSKEASCKLRWLLACLTLWPSRCRQPVPMKPQWTSTGLHTITSQKITIFKVTAVRTSKETSDHVWILCHLHHAFFILESSVTLPIASVNKIRIQMDGGQVKMDKWNPNSMTRQQWLMLDLVTK